MRTEIDEYVRQREAEGWSAKTSKCNRYRLEKMADALGDPRPAAVQPRDLERYLRGLKRSGWKREGRRSVASTARCFFAWLAEHGRIPSDPALGLGIERNANPELPDPPLSQEEVGVILDGLPRRNALDLRNKALLEMLYGCGLRLNEALGLDLGDVNIHNRVLRADGKGGKPRDLPLGRGALLALRDYLALRRSLLRGPDSGALFLDRKGRRMADNQVWQWFVRLNKARGPRARHLHPHLFRHSIAVHLLQNGADVRYIQQFLGHVKLDTTKIYLRLVPGRLKEDYDKAFPDIAV